MAGIVNGYATVAQVKAHYDPSGAGGSLDDAIIEDKITAASRILDEECKTRFYTTAADETRYYTADESDELWLNDGAIRDILSITTLATDDDEDRVYETTWATTDYDLRPFNAGLDGLPYTHIKVTPNGRYSFPVGVEKGVKIVGKFGHSATAPIEIQEACITLATFLLMAMKAVLGTVGGGEVGTEVRLARMHPTVITLKEKYNTARVG